MFKFYTALNFKANKANDHEILARSKKSFYEKKKRKYFSNATIECFLINVGWVENAAQLTVECLPQTIMLVYFWELLQQRSSNS